MTYFPRRLFPRKMIYVALSSPYSAHLLCHATANEQLLASMCDQATEVSDISKLLLWSVLPQALEQQCGSI